MSSSSGPDNEQQRKAQEIAQSQALIAEYPAEAQLIMAALEDGLTFGPAQAASARPGF